MDAQKILSADSHVIEPADVWTSRIDKRFLDRAPRVIKHAGSREGDFFVAEGLRPFPVAGFAVAGVDPKDFAEKMAGGYPGVRPSAWDPELRIKDQERDGVSGEVLYPSLGMRLFQMEDGELRAACFRAYNDWLADYCAHSPRRLAGVAMVSLDDPLEGVEELRRAGEQGPARRDDMGRGAGRASLQRPVIRSILGGGARSRNADQPAYPDRAARRQRFSKRDERLPGAASFGRAIAHRNYFRRRARTLPQAQARVGRKRHRMDSAFSPAPRPLVREVSLPRKARRSRIRPATIFGGRSPQLFRTIASAW